MPPPYSRQTKNTRQQMENIPPLPVGAPNPQGHQKGHPDVWPVSVKIPFPVLLQLLQRSRGVMPTDNTAASGKGVRTPFGKMQQLHGGSSIFSPDIQAAQGVASGPFTVNGPPIKDPSIFCSDHHAIQTPFTQRGREDVPTGDTAASDKEAWSTLEKILQLHGSGILPPDIQAAQRLASGPLTVNNGPPVEDPSMHCAIQTLFAQSSREGMPTGDMTAGDVFEKIQQLDGSSGILLPDVQIAQGLAGGSLTVNGPPTEDSLIFYSDNHITTDNYTVIDDNSPCNAAAFGGYHLGEVWSDATPPVNHFPGETQAYADYEAAFDTVQGGLLQQPLLTDKSWDNTIIGGNDFWYQ
jgi:hypothetical protein